MVEESISTHFVKSSHSSLSKTIAPHALVTAYLFWILLRPYPVYFLGSLGSRLIDLSVLIILLLLYFPLLERNNSRLKLNRVSWLFLLLFIQMILALVYGRVVLGAEVIARDLFEFYRMPYYLLMVNFAYQIHWDDRLLERYLFRPLVWVGMLIISFGITQRFNLFNVNYILTPFYRDKEKLVRDIINKGRIVSTLSNPSHYGLFLVWLIIFLLGLAFLKRRKLLLAWTGLALISVWWTSSRTALLVLLGTLIYWMWQLVRLRRLSRTKAVILIVTIVIILILLFNYLLLHSENRYMLDMLKRIRHGDFWQLHSLQLRFNVWQRQLNFVKKSPVMGWGPAKSETGSVSDNQYLFILKRYGLIGLALFLTIMFKLYRLAGTMLASSQTKSKQVLFVTFRCMIVALAVANLAGEFADSLQHAGFFYLLGGIVCRISFDSKVGGHK
jgi:O-antigen ligase